MVPAFLGRDGGGRVINNRRLERDVNVRAVILIQLCRIFKSKCCAGIFRKNNVKALGLIYRYCKQWEWGGAEEGHFLLRGSRATFLLIFHLVFSELGVHLSEPQRWPCVRSDWEAFLIGPFCRHVMGKPLLRQKENEKVTSAKERQMSFPK